jgi:predicted adenylyl cyclase CyaB
LLFKRTRNEGKKITFTIKEKSNTFKKQTFFNLADEKQSFSSSTYDKEWEVNVDNQNIMNDMLQLLGVKKTYTLEKFREIYKDDNNELVFDHYPGLEPYLEIESNTEDNLFKIMKKLNLESENKFNSKDLYYLEYGMTKERPDDNLTFDNALEIFDIYITKNKEKFIKILNHQQKFIKKYQKKL